MNILEKRVNATTEFLQNIKIIKLYNWESNFIKNINHLRNNELKQLKYNCII